MFDINDYKINVLELEPVTNTDNLIHIIHNNKTEILKEAVAQRVNESINGAIERAKADYLAAARAYA